MNLPDNIRFSKSHEWITIDENNTAKIGISDFAQDSMGDIVFINLPSVGDTFSAGDEIGDVESVKAVSEIYSPVSGTVSAINEELLTSPELVNDDPYGSWFIEIEEAAFDDSIILMTSSEYEEFCQKEG
ncbi:MAG: glycine cleavage system protein GcvH [Ruminococcaceae bacterium]|jgi:glycine cleavage system H protein|nr:glycine cleavage system protein GcvH [Oscillospiraceae bacterium]